MENECARMRGGVTSTVAKDSMTSAAGTNIFSYVILSIRYHRYERMLTFQLAGLKKNAGSDWMSSTVALGYHPW